MSSSKRSLSPTSREIHNDRYPLQKQKSVSDIIGPMISDLDLTQGSLASLAEANKTMASRSSLETGKNGSTCTSTDNSSGQSSPDAGICNGNSTAAGGMPWSALPDATSHDDISSVSEESPGLSVVNSQQGTSGKADEQIHNGDSSNDGVYKTTERLPSDDDNDMNDEKLPADDEEVVPCEESRSHDDSLEKETSTDNNDDDDEEEQITMKSSESTELSPEQLLNHFQDMTDMTDVDGRVTDAVCAAAKKGVKLTKKGIEVVADDIEAVYKGTKHLAGKAAQDVVDCGVGLEDALGTVMNMTVNKLGVHQVRQQVFLHFRKVVLTLKLFFWIKMEFKIITLI